MKIKKVFSRMFTSLAFILSMFGFSVIVNNANLVHAEGEKVPESLNATYTGTILSGTTINPMSIEIVLTYSDDSTEPVDAGTVEYWYEGEQIENPIAYVFDHQILGGFGNKSVTVKYQGLETTMLVEIVGHEITFNANGGTNNMPPYVWVGDYGLPQNQFVAPEGKKFAGWALTSDGNIINEPSYNVTQDTEFFAIWVDLENVTITFDAGDGTGTMSPVVVVEGSTYTLPVNEFTAPAGHEFHAWNIVDTFDKFAEGYQVTIETNTTFVALWTPLEMEEITATYTGTILAGTTINPAGISINAVYEDSSTTPINAGNVEYWYNESQIQDPVNYVFGVELIGNINITVKYEGLETTMAVTVVGHQITFNANGGTGTMTATEHVGNYTLPANGFTAPEGKHFKGWATSAIGNVIEGATYNVTSDTTLYAIWEENSSAGPATPEQPENNNPTAEPESKGLGAGAIVGIVTASLVVLGTGGFSVVWFIVKKKTWADFVAVFKKK